MVRREDVVPVPQVVLEGNRLLQDCVQDLTIDLRRRLADQQPFQLVLIARILPGAGGVCALHCLGYPAYSHEAMFRRGGRGERLDEVL